MIGLPRSHTTTVHIGHDASMFASIPRTQLPCTPGHQLNSEAYLYDDIWDNLDVPELHFSSETVFHNILKFYEGLADKTDNILPYISKLYKEMSDLSSTCRACLVYVCAANFSTDENTAYYNRVSKLKYAHKYVNEKSNLSWFCTVFPTAISFRRYCQNVKNIGAVEQTGSIVHITTELCGQPDSVLHL